MAYKREAEGSIYLYEASQTITINDNDTYHALIGALEGSKVKGVTYLASATGSITDTANNGGVLRCTDVGHGLTTGQYITINGMGDSAHNGVTVVTVIDADTFDAEDITYNSDNDTGSWQRGTSLTIDDGYGGTYAGGFSITGAAATANKNYKVEVYQNATALDEFAVEAIFPNTGYNNISSAGIGLLEAGDVLWCAIENNTDATNFVLHHFNLHLHK